MTWRFGTLVAALMTLWFVFFLLSNVDTRDVVAYNDIEKHVGSQPFRAGDLITVSTNGPAPRWVCSPPIEAGGIKDTRLEKTYVNGLGQALKPFTDLVGWIVELAGGKPPTADVEADTVAVNFTGRISDFTEVKATPMFGADCNCKIAAALLNREQVCMVERSMIESRVSGPDLQGRIESSERTVGISLRPRNVIFEAAAIAAMNCPDLQNANLKLELQTGACASGPGPGYDVALRQTLRVIREVSFAEKGG